MRSTPTRLGFPSRTTDRTEKVRPGNVGGVPDADPVVEDEARALPGAPLGTVLGEPGSAGEPILLRSRAVQRVHGDLFGLDGHRGDHRKRQHNDTGQENDPVDQGAAPVTRRWAIEKTLHFRRLPIPAPAWVSALPMAVFLAVKWGGIGERPGPFWGFWRGKVARLRRGASRAGTDRTGRAKAAGSHRRGTGFERTRHGELLLACAPGEATGPAAGLASDQADARISASRSASRCATCGASFGAPASRCAAASSTGSWAARATVPRNCAA